jgi:hypothetical protein
LWPVGILDISLFGILFPALVWCTLGNLGQVRCRKCFGKPPIGGLCYDHNFVQFSTIFGEKFTLFSKTNAMINFLRYYICT